MHSTSKLALLVITTLTAIACSGGSAAVPGLGDTAGVGSTDATAGEGRDSEGADLTLRVATYNVSMFRSAAGELAAELAAPGSDQPDRIAAVLAAVDADIVVLQEFDIDAGAVSGFATNYLEPAGLAELAANAFQPTSNTGAPSGVDLDGNGSVGGELGSDDYANDAFGFGRYPGQYGFVVYSRWPVDLAATRTFGELRWADMPDNLLPTEYYSDEAAAVFRLSSKNHADIVVQTPAGPLHLLVSHPTPPSFDGAEDRNGRRNHDEIRFWTDYIGGANWMVGEGEPLPADARFVVLGDLNSDPVDGDSRHEGIADLLAHPRVIDPGQRSEGAAAATASQGRANANHRGDPALDTADWNDNSVGNLRVDYVLPSANLAVLDGGVFWLAPPTDPEGLSSASDHHLVWVDLEM